jgi:hypothetical protein
MTFKDSHFLPILIILIIVVIMGIFFYKTDRATLIPGHDNQIFIPCAFKLIDPDFYSKDIELKYAQRFYPVSNLYLWSLSYRIFGDLKKATFAIYLIYGSIYILGT